MAIITHAVEVRKGARRGSGAAYACAGTRSCRAITICKRIAKRMRRNDSIGASPAHLEVDVNVGPPGTWGRLGGRAHHRSFSVLYSFLCGFYVG